MKWMDVCIFFLLLFFITTIFFFVGEQWEMYEGLKNITRRNKIIKKIKIIKNIIIIIIEDLRNSITEQF